MLTLYGRLLVQRILVLGILLSAASVVDVRAQQTTATTPEQRYFDWTRPQFSTVEYRHRRDDMILPWLRAAGGGVLLIPGVTGNTRGLTFRQADDFMYFTGLELPSSVLALDADAQTSTLFVPARDARFENSSRPNDFPGRPLATDSALVNAGYVTRIVPAADLEKQIAAWVAAGKTIWVDAPQAGKVPRISVAPIADWDPQTAFTFYLQQKYPALELRNAFELVARARMVKSAAEIDVMRRAAQLTSRAIASAARSVRAGVDERALEAEFEAACKRGGAQRLSFASIIKSGPNSLWAWRILATHYNRRNRAMEAGDLVIMDVGCELDGYSSDVGRTFPVSGKFTPDQRAALELSTAVSDAVIAAVHPGVTLGQLQQVAMAKIPADKRKYMQTGLYFGHHLGLSSGDPFLPDAVLQPGMVFTIEPWYYDHDHDISVFIEDDLLVTPTGVEVLTASLPRSPDALAALMNPARRNVTP